MSITRLLSHRRVRRLPRSPVSCRHARVTSAVPSVRGATNRLVALRVGESSQRGPSHWPLHFSGKLEPAAHRQDILREPLGWKGIFPGQRQFKQHDTGIETRCSLLSSKPEIQADSVLRRPPLHFHRERQRGFQNRRRNPEFSKKPPGSHDPPTSLGSCPFAAAGRVPVCPKPPSWPVEGSGALPSPIFVKQSNSLLMRAAVFVPRSV